MANIKTKKSGIDSTKYFILLNGDIIGFVKKDAGKWTASTDKAGFEHVVYTSKTKKDAVETWVHKFLTDGREGY